MEKFNPNEHLISLKGKDYLQVMWRLVWFRQDKPMWCIDTTPVTINEESAIFTAKIFDENGALKASGYGSETKRDFGDFIEKAETKAIGRALAMMGYGTQFAPELDEGERIVDSPVNRKIQLAKEHSLPTKPQEGKPNVFQKVYDQLTPETSQKSIDKTLAEGSAKLTSAEIKQILEAADNDPDKAKAAIAKYGYKNSKDVLRSHLNNILDDLLADEQLPWEAGRE